MSTYAHRYVVSVVIADRSGILSRITAAITDLGADIEGISQTVLQGYFTVIVIAAFETPLGAHPIQQAVMARFAAGETSVLVRPYEPAVQGQAQGDRYILTLSGKDRPGILKALTTYLAERHINIEDWYFSLTNGFVTHVGEVTVPPRLDLRQVQDDLRATLIPFGLSANLQHENLFRATNEVGSIRRIIKGHGHA